MGRKTETLYPLCFCKLNKFPHNVVIMSIEDKETIFIRIFRVSMWLKVLDTH